MEAIWSRIEAWLAGNAPDLLGSLNGGATSQEIQETDAFLGVELPADFKASARIHDGQSEHSAGLIDGWGLLSLERIRDEWSVWKDLLDGGVFDGIAGEPEGPIANDWWNPKWIPVTYSGAGDHHCLDLSPPAGGSAGQIIVMWHDDPARPLIARSFRTWLQTFADALEAGRYVYSKEDGALLPPDDV